MNSWLNITENIFWRLLCNTELTGGEAKRQGELPQELPETEPGYVGTGTGQARRKKQRGKKKKGTKTSKG